MSVETVRYKPIGGFEQRPDAKQTIHRTAKPRFVVAPRTCLRCGKVFDSIGPGNRRCYDCGVAITHAGVGVRTMSLGAIRRGNNVR
jgi:tRNA(Ile2) C34 agmatinyltransferase TiaS